MKYFETRFFEEADEFVSTLHPKVATKMLYDIRLAEHTNDPRLFKKLRDDIWEFRLRYNGLQIRLLAFWDKADSSDTLVFVTYGFNKKVYKIPGNEIQRAKNIRQKYFEEKN